METVEINKGITLIYVQATSFPSGVMEAYQKLHSLLPTTEGRNFFGISHGDKKGGIVYMAAVEESYTGEATKLGCNTFIVPEGKYLEEKLMDWQKDVTQIGRTFQKLIADPRIDKNGFCLEIYSDDGGVRCLAKTES